MVLDEIRLPAGEDGSVVDQELASHGGIGDDDVELVANKEGVQRAELFRPRVERKFGIVWQGRKTKEGTRWDGVAIFIHNILSEKEGNDEVEDSCCNEEQS